MINPQNSYPSNHSDGFTQTFNTSSVTAVAGNVIELVHVLRLTDNQVAAPPTWNGEVFTLRGAPIVNEAARVYVYGLVCTTSGTFPILCSPTDWSMSASIARVFTGDIDLADPFLPIVTSFEDGTSTPYSDPSSGIATTTRDLAVDYLASSNQDLVGNNLTGQTFTEGGSQTSKVTISHSVNNFIGHLLSTTKVAVDGTTQMSWDITQEARYIYIVTGIRGIAATSIDSYPATIRAGQTNVPYTTSGLTSVTEVSVGTLSGTGISDTAGVGDHDIPPLVDEVAYELFGTKTVTITGPDGSPTTTTSFLPSIGNTYVVLGNNIDTSVAGIVYNYLPSAEEFDQIVFPVGINVNNRGQVTGPAGYYQIWHIAADTKIARSTTIILGDTLPKGKNNWKIATAFKLARTAPMLAIGPLPSSGQYAYHKWADTNALYKVRVCWRGGQPPFRLTMLAGPATARLGQSGKIQEWDRTQDPDIPTMYHHTLPAEACYVKWQPTPADAGQTVSFSILVEDQNNQTLTFNWSTTVDNSKSMWLDSNTGNDGNVGSFASPKATLTYGFTTQTNADQYIYRLKNGVYAAGHTIGATNDPKCILGYGNNVVLDCSINGGFYGAADDVCLMDLILDGTPPHASDNYKVIATSWSTHRRYYHNLKFRNIVPTSNTDNAAIIFTPGIDFPDFGTYLAITDCESIDNVGAQLVCTYAQNYVIAENNKGDLMTPAGVGSNKFLHFKDQTSYVTERFNYCKGDSNGNGLISFANQYPINVTDQESLYSFLDYTGNTGYSPLMWNGQGTTPPHAGTVMWAQRLSIRCGNGGDAAIFAPDWGGGIGENLNVADILWSSSGNDLINTSVGDGATEVQPSSKILDSQWTADMKMVSAVKAANLGLFGAEIASTNVVIPGIVLTPIDTTTSTRHTLAPGTTATLTVVSDATPDVVQTYTSTVDVLGDVAFTDSNWILGQVKEAVIKIGSISQAITFMVSDV